MKRQWNTIVQRVMLLRHHGRFIAIPGGNGKSSKRSDFCVFADLTCAYGRTRAHSLRSMDKKSVSCLQRQTYELCSALMRRLGPIPWMRSKTSVEARKNTRRQHILKGKIKINAMTKMEMKKKKKLKTTTKQKIKTCIWKLRSEHESKLCAWWWYRKKKFDTLATQNWSHF